MKNMLERMNLTLKFGFTITIMLIVLGCSMEERPYPVMGSTKNLPPEYQKTIHQHMVTSSVTSSDDPVGVKTKRW